MKPEMKRVLVCLALAASMTAIAVPISAGAASDGPTATAAKKKKKKKCKAACQRAKATNFLKGSLLFRSGCSTTPACDRSYDERFGFCKNGTYAAKFEYDNTISGSYANTFSGAWRVSAANNKQATATVPFTITAWNSAYFDGSPGPDAQPGTNGTLHAPGHRQQHLRERRGVLPHGQRRGLLSRARDGVSRRCPPARWRVPRAS